MESLKDIFGLPATSTEHEVRLAAREAVSAQDWVMSDPDRARLFTTRRPFAPTPHRSPDGVELERGAVGVSTCEDKL